MATVHSLAKLMKFIDRTEWAEVLGDITAEHIQPACARFRFAPADLLDCLNEIQLANLRGSAFEDLMSRNYEGGRNVVDEYIKRRGYAETGGNKRYMQQLRRSVMSLHEISDVEPGQSFRARDLLRGGDPMLVLEVSGSKSLKQWDRIGARLLWTGEEWRMSGAVHLYDRETSERLIEKLRGIDRELPADLRKVAAVGNSSGLVTLKRDLDSAPPLAAVASIFTQTWLADALDKILKPRVPKLFNTDGHPVFICTSRFPFLPGRKTRESREACVAALQRALGLVRDGTWSFDWVRPAGEPNAVERPAVSGGVMLKSENAAGDILLGSVTVKTKTIELHTNSRERAAAGEAIVAKALQGLVGAVSREETDGEQVMAQAAAERGQRQPGTKRSSNVPPEVERSLIHEHLDKHYRETLDRPIGMLDDMTPREAARSPYGRSKVVEWLKQAENQAAKDRSGAGPMASYDFGWIWHELGVDEHRR